MPGEGLATALAAVTCVLLAAGCNLSRAGTGPQDASVAEEASPDTEGGGGAEGSPGDDGPHDGGTEPDGPCHTVTCNGACVPTCDGCDAGTAPCLVTGVCGDCTTCGSLTLECFACNDAGVLAYCSSPADPCGLAPAAHCPCTFGDPGGCPGANQVCIEPGFCLSCGEDNSANITCANGLECVGSPPDASCSGS